MDDPVATEAAFRGLAAWRRRVRRPTAGRGGAGEDTDPAPPSIGTARGRHRLRPHRRGGPQRGATGRHRPRHVAQLAAAGPAHHAGPQGHLRHLADPVVPRPDPPGPDPPPAEQGHHQLDRAPHGPAQLLRLVDRGPRAAGRGVRLHRPAVPLRDGLRHRVRPAEHHLRAPHQDVVLVLRPGPVGPAHLPGQLRHPLGPDVHDLRAADPRPVLDRRRRLLRSC